MDPGGSGGSAPAPAPGSKDFASTPAQKKAAANTIETELEPATKKAAEHADSATSTAQKGFEGWETAAGLKKVADTWDQQVKSLMARLASEKTALRGAHNLITGNDTGIRSQFLASDSKLNGV
ncbi:hypothetical protein ABZ128_31505 [Streptomyces sp. NPDC006326]|uniref:hypothetical protein n=1 Tax=Streptomyces sp. NPDC006326 TaxID=3156752 RepID=UPI0033AC6C90